METWNPAEHGRPTPSTFTGTICQCWHFLSSWCSTFPRPRTTPKLPRQGPAGGSDPLSERPGRFVARLATNEERPHHPIHPRITVQRQGRSAVAFHGGPPWRPSLLDRRSCQTNILAVPFGIPTLLGPPSCVDRRYEYREASSSDDGEIEEGKSLIQLLSQ